MAPHQNQKWGLTDTRFKWSGTNELALRQNSDADCCSKEDGQDELTWLFQSFKSKKLPKNHILFCVHLLPLDFVKSAIQWQVLHPMWCYGISLHLPKLLSSTVPVLPPSPFLCPAQHPTTQSSAQSSKVQSSESLAFDAIGPDAVERCSPIRDGLLVPGDLGKGNTVVGFNMDL